MTKTIQTWQERMSKSGKRECESLAIDLMQAEITDLRAAHAADQEAIRVLREALERLARLGNGTLYGNSDGNRIAQQALAATKGE